MTDKGVLSCGVWATVTEILRELAYPLVVGSRLLTGMSTTPRLAEALVGKKVVRHWSAHREVTFLGQPGDPDRSNKQDPGVWAWINWPISGNSL